MAKEDWELNHVGLVVRNYNVPLGYYQTTGLGVSVGPQIVTHDFAELPGEPKPAFFNFEKVGRLNGGSGPGKPLPPEPALPDDAKRDTYGFMDKDCQVGDLLFEILQMKDIPFEGITHLCYNVRDPEKETNKLIDKGCEIVLSFNKGDTILENYMDTRKYGNVIISFRPLVAKYEKAWAAHNRAHPMVSDWKFYGFGIGVRDLDKTVAYYQHLNVGEFKSENRLESGDLKPIGDADTASVAAVSARVQTAQIGPVAFEFIQPLEGEAIYQASLDSRGEGICDIAFKVNDLEAEMAKLAARNIEIALSGKPSEGPAFAYFDTREGSGNIMIRLIQKE